MIAALVLALAVQVADTTPRVDSIAVRVVAPTPADSAIAYAQAVRQLHAAGVPTVVRCRARCGTLTIRVAPGSASETRAAVAATVQVFVVSWWRHR